MLKVLIDGGKMFVSASLDCYEHIYVVVAQYNTVLYLVSRVFPPYGTYRG